MAVEQGQRLSGRPAPCLGQREGARQRAQLPHRRRRPDAAAGDVAHHDAEPAVRQLERVVPIAAHLDADPGHLVGGGQLDPRTSGRLLGISPRWSSTAIRCSSSCSWARRMASAVRSAASWSSERSVVLNDRPGGSARRRQPTLAPSITSGTCRHRSSSTAGGSPAAGCDLCGHGAHDHRLIELARDLHLGHVDLEQLGQAGRQLGQQLVQRQSLERRGQRL